jgi:hypothetical protein
MLFSDPPIAKAADYIDEASLRAVLRSNKNVINAILSLASASPCVNLRANVFHVEHLMKHE